MDNIEVFSRHFFNWDKNFTSKIVKATLEDQWCCFITSDNILYIGQNDLDTIQTTELPFSSNTVVNLKYLDFWRIVFICTEHNLVLWDLNDGLLKYFCIHHLKFLQSSWNLHQTSVILIDEIDHVISYNFLVDEASVEKYRFVEDRYVSLIDPVPNYLNVGWGSPNTQFKGSPREDDKVEHYPQEYGYPRISWRGNGEQLVINFWKNLKRSLKVFDSNLKPLYELESYPNLLPPVSFKGQGNFIACAATHNEQNKIVIFEKNCLVKHESFIPNAEGEIQDLKFHPELPILAVYSEGINKSGYLNIYLNSNAHWYLKQQLFYPHEKQLKYFHWTKYYDKNTCCLNVLTIQGLENILFKIVINRFVNAGLVAVIDGTKANFTRIASEIIPPPMCSFTVFCKTPINRIWFESSLSIYRLLLSDNDIVNVSFNGDRFETFTGDADLSLVTVNDDDYEESISSAETIINNAKYKFTLTKQNDLLINKILISKNILSMLVFENYLLFTHAFGKLYCVRLVLKNILIPNWDLKKLYGREVEQGTKIVGITSTLDVVLVLPRGNLETISCRLVAIDILEQLLAANQWADAICKIRQLKLNWNLLIDLNPDRFCEHLDEFIRGVETVSVLNAIVSEFNKDNCLKTMYAHCFDIDKAYPETDKKQILLKILQKIVSVNPILNLLSIVIIQIKHFSLKSALTSICKAYELGNFKISEKAMALVLLHAHAKDVINRAYTLYSVNFMKFVYACCSHDPKVFEPELDQLYGLQPVELRYKMNVLGKEFACATRYLVRCRNYDDEFITNFITKHVSHREAYRSVTSKQPNFVLVSRLFSKYLALRSKYNEAGIVLERAGLYSEAVSKYQKASNWEKVVYLLEQLDEEDNVKKEILMDIAEDLVQQKKVDEAALLYEYYCGQYRKAILLFVEKQMFQKALALTKNYNCTDIEEGIIVPAIVKYRQDLLDKITELRIKFLDYSTRLRVLRQKKLHTLKQRLLEGDDAVDSDHSEYGSLFSVGSTSSRISTQSSRNRRKLEKKKIDLRKGGTYEDIALIRQLYLLAVDIFDCGQEVKEICLTLVDDASFRFNKSLHATLSGVQEMVKLNIPRIWSDIFLNSTESSIPEVLAIIENRNELDVQYRNPPPSEALKDDWKLLMFTT